MRSSGEGKRQTAIQLVAARVVTKMMAKKNRGTFGCLRIVADVLLATQKVLAKKEAKRKIDSWAPIEWNSQRPTKPQPQTETNEFSVSYHFAGRWASRVWSARTHQSQRNLHSGCVV